MADNSSKFHVNSNEAGQRLDEFLASRLGDISRMRIRNLISQGICQVNGAVRRAGDRIDHGDIVAVDAFEYIPSAMTPQDIPIEVVFEDSDLMVVVKPAGMLVHPTSGVKVGTLANALTYHLNKTIFESASGENGTSTGLDSSSAAVIPATVTMVRPGIVHRLDKATSGLMIIAKTPHALSVLARHFRRGLVKKRYLAVVRGLFSENYGMIEAPIGRDPDRRPHWWVSQSGKHAETRWKVVSRGEDKSLAELEPVTGRTNQLRIHAAYIGHPILGDPLYGESAAVIQCAGVMEGSHIGDYQSEASSPGRLLLHAWRLAFHHPETGVWKEFVSGPGPEMAAYLEANGMADWTVSIASIRLADPLAVLDTDSGSQIRHARHPGNHILDLGQAERLGND